MTEYISGEKHREIVSKQGRKEIEVPKSLLKAIIIIVLMGLCFYGGVAYQKGRHGQSTTAASTNANGQGGFGAAGGRRFGNGQRPTIGPVTAISAASITVQDSRTGSSITLSITSSTQITDNGQTAAASDIQTGDTVLVTASTSDKTQAARILVNPSFGGAGGSQGTSGSTNAD